MTSVLILKKISDKARQDFPDDFIKNSEIKFLQYRDGMQVKISERIIHQYNKVDSTGNTVSFHEDEMIPDNIKEVLLEANNIPNKGVFDPLSEPCRRSFLYEEIVNKGELLGDAKLKSLGLSRKKR
jgi:hypothetical protein